MWWRQPSPPRSVPIRLACSQQVDSSAGRRLPASSPGSSRLESGRWFASHSRESGHIMRAARRWPIPPRNRLPPDPRQDPAHQDPAHQRTVERAELVLNASGYHESEGEHHDGNGEYHGGLRPLPPELFFQRGYEHAPCVKSSEGEVHREPAHYPPPTADAGLLHHLRFHFVLAGCHDCISCCLPCRFRLRAPR